MLTNMDVMAGGIGPDVPIAPTLSRPHRPEPGDKSLQSLDQRAQLPVWEVPDDSAESHGSTSASSPSAVQETNKDAHDPCDRMIEKWRSIKVADKNRAQKKVANVNVRIYIGG